MVKAIHKLAEAVDVLEIAKIDYNYLKYIASTPDDANILENLVSSIEELFVKLDEFDKLIGA